MDLKSRDTDQVLNLVEPWKVSKGDYVLHTRKVNLIDRYMLGTFIWADDVHMGVQEEKYRPIEPGVFCVSFALLPFSFLTLTLLVRSFSQWVFPTRPNTATFCPTLCFFHIITTTSPPHHLIIT